MLSTKKALPNLTKSIIFAMAATVSMSVSAGDIVVEDAEALTVESTELVITEGQIVNAEGEVVEMTAEELAEKEALEQELLENQAQDLIIPAE